MSTQTEAAEDQAAERAANSRAALRDYLAAWAHLRATATPEDRARAARIVWLKEEDAASTADLLADTDEERVSAARLARIANALRQAAEQYRHHAAGK